VVGGGNDKTESIKAIECYNPSTDEWSEVWKITEKLVCYSLITV